MVKTSESQTCLKPQQANHFPDIQTFDDQDDLELDLNQIKSLVVASLRKLDLDCDELAIYFVSEDSICSLHQTHFNDPTPTDCITIPFDVSGDRSSGRCFLGEAFICTKVAIEQSKEHGTTPTLETMRYVVHCLLHMAGYDDQTDEEREEMRCLEDSLLTIECVSR